MEREAADDSLQDADLVVADLSVADLSVADEEQTVAKSSTRAPAKPKAAKASEAAAPAAGAASNVLTSARASATPLDYGTYAPPADVAPTFAAARSEEALGRWAQAADLWRTLTRDARPDVVQEASLRGAKALRNAGRGADALTLVDTGLRASSANTPVRAALYALRGDIASALGRTAEAEAAWSEAAKLNAAR